MEDANSFVANSNKLGVALELPVSDCNRQPSEIEAKKQDTQLEFLSLNAVLACLEKCYKEGFEPGQNPLLRIPSGWMQELVILAMKDQPWVPMQHLVVQAGSIAIPLDYWIFDFAGRRAEFQEWHRVAMERKMSTFDGIWDFVNGLWFNDKGGWKSVKAWWPEIIERAIRQHPDLPLQDLELTHKGKTKKLMYASVCLDKSSEEGDENVELAELRRLYDQKFGAYLDSSFENTLRYISKGMGGFSWGKVPPKWHREYLRRVIAANPLKDPLDNKVGLQYNGKLIKPPVDYYKRQGTYSDLVKMVRELRREYLGETESLQRVVDYLSCGAMHAWGGWSVVPEKFHKRLIVNAVVQSKEERPERSRLTYTYGGKVVSLERLFRIFRDSDRLKEFEEYYQEGLKLRQQYGIRAAEPKDKEESGSRSAQKEAVLVLVRAVEAGDRDAMGKLIVVCNSTIKSKVLEYARKAGRFNDEQLRHDLTMDGIEKLYQCVKSFKESKGKDFFAYLKIALDNLFQSRLKFYAKGMSESDSRQSVNRYCELRRKLPEGVSPERATVQEVAEALEMKLTCAGGITRMLQARTVSAEDEHPTREDETIRDNIRDRASNVAEIVSISSDAMVLMGLVLDDFGRRERFMFKQYYGLSAGRHLDAYELEKISRNPNIRELIEASVRTFVEEVAAFCEKPYVAVDVSKVMPMKKALTERKDINPLLEGECTLSEFLGTEIDSVLMTVFVRILSGLKREEAIIVSEIFDLPKEEDITYKQIGKILGCSDEAIRLKVIGLRKRFKKSLRGKFGITGSEFLFEEKEEIPEDIAA